MKTYERHITEFSENTERAAFKTHSNITEHVFFSEDIRKKNFWHRLSYALQVTC
uniref:Uncharacterized protein n=1 Tax=Nelumbo nucifera TaxID=4432 RepID=A0A822YII2_NELNU|nr:TPA_asm: hypothetical protein HUJ06_011188 [Nelumbo nucifera]